MNDEAFKRFTFKSNTLSLSHLYMSTDPAVLCSMVETPRRSTAADSDSNKNFKVVVRIRPPLDRELTPSYRNIVKVENNNKRLIVKNTSETSDHSSSSNAPPIFSFDHVFDHNSTQSDVFESSAKDAVLSTLIGYNASIIAYGQTGTGKTYTMQGPDDILVSSELFSNEFAGVIPRAVQLVFDRLRSDFSDFTVTCSHLELYNEELIDLLGDGSTNLRILEDRKGVRVDGQEERHVRGPMEVLQLLQQGFKTRKTACTNLNERSSRSHCIFSMNIHTREVNSEGDDVVRLGKLNLVDLAGSENVGRSGAQGINLKEAGMINQSLLTLSRVIVSLLKKRGTTHVPYRESKLTRLLQESLGGRTKTVLVATISSSNLAVEDTLSTLRYAKLAKHIENKPEVNQRKQRQLLADKLAEIENMKKAMILEFQNFLSEQAPHYQNAFMELSQAFSVLSSHCAKEHDKRLDYFEKLEDSRAMDLPTTISNMKDTELDDYSQTVSSLEVFKTKLTSTEEEFNQFTSGLNLDF
ncbi:hypothetical protein GEMRC1_013825 [Eukaryota sp. GEM-RC1]